MVQRLVAFALRMPFIVLALAGAVIISGLIAYHALDIEAYPNPVPPLVEVIAQPEGANAEEVERYVTVPLELGLAGMPGIDHIRSSSLFGLSDLKCYFKWGTNYQAARQDVLNRLQSIKLPEGSEARISPWNPVGEIFRYTVHGKGYDLAELKTAQDWILERQFKQVPGVSDVTSFGGETKQYHVELDPYRLSGQGTSLEQVMQAISKSNENAGGQRLVLGEQSYSVRGVGILRNVHDIEDIVITEHNGIPVRLREVADSAIGYAPRLGIVGLDEQPDVVQGIVLMRYGNETSKTLDGVYERLEHIRQFHLLPPGMDIAPYYDRGRLVAVTTHTVLENLFIGMALVALVLLLFLGNTRAAIITAINIPIALLVAFCGLVITGTSANLISLGAVDFGIVVDSTVIMMESIFRHVGSHGKGTMKERVFTGAREVTGPMTFSTLIIGVAFLPLFTMGGVAGVIFSPMAHTYAFAIGGAILMAVTLTPVLATRFVRIGEEERESFIMRGLHRLYTPLANAALARPRMSAGLAMIPILLCAVLYPLLGNEFMPKLEEGNFWIRATLPMSISIDRSAAYVGRMRSIVRGCPKDPNIPCTEENRTHPEVLTVVSQVGRPDDGTDVSGFHNIELFAPLRPFEEWRGHLTKAKLTEQLSAELADEFPGVIFNFSQAISDNVEEAISGVKGENSIKVVGPDLETNERSADAVVDVMSGVKGIKDLGMFHSLGQPEVKITADRQACARYGLNTGHVMEVVEAAIGGRAITQVYEGEKHFALTVRWREPYRKSIEDIREITLTTPDHTVVPLAQVASVTIAEGPSMIYREDGSRYSPVKFSVRGRDLKSTIAEARQKIGGKVHLPYDSHFEWGGEINELNEAMGRLVIVIPLTLFAIIFLVYGAVKSWIDTVIVVLSIPIACTGGVLALLLTRTNFSVSAAMGFISIFGIAVQDSLLVVSYFQRLRKTENHSIVDAARVAAEQRFRPVLMTTLVAMLGLFPAAISNGIGAQTQKPLAIVVIGGALILAVLSRVLRPPLLVLAHTWLEAHRRRLTPFDDPLEESSRIP